MKTDMIEEVTDLFKALSDPTRLSLLLELEDGEMTVSQLASYSGTSMANISKHLTLMKRMGIVIRRKAGNQVYYSIRKKSILDICDLVREEIEERYGRKKPAPVSPVETSPIEDAEEAEITEILQPRLTGFNSIREENGLDQHTD